jgi:hypothetical protein
VRERANHRGQLGLDQGLVDRLGCLPDPVIDLGGLECIQDFQQGRLVQGHRVSVSFCENIGVVSLTITRWPSVVPQARR